MRPPATTAMPIFAPAVCCAALPLEELLDAVLLVGELVAVVDVLLLLVTAGVELEPVLVVLEVEPEVDDPVDDDPVDDDPVDEAAPAPPVATTPPTPDPVGRFAAPTFWAALA